MKKNDVSMDHFSSRHVTSSMTLRDAMEKVKHQIEYGDFYNERMRCIPAQVGEICLIIAEVLLLNPDTEINIERRPIRAGIAQEVFSSLEHAHVQLVIDNFKSVTGKIQRKKSYLRTALYNSFFEIDSHYQNQVTHDFWN